MAQRTKVVSEPTDLVPVLRSFDTPVKRAVFRMLTDDWVTENQVVEEHGEAGREALEFFEQANLVETEFQPGDGGMEKAFQTYYSSFNLNTSAPVDEMAEILGVAVMPDDEFQELEDQILELAEGDETRLHAVAEKLGTSVTRLEAIVKRTPHLEVSGHHLEVVE